MEKNHERHAEIHYPYVINAVSTLGIVGILSNKAYLSSLKVVSKNFGHCTMLEYLQHLSSLGKFKLKPQWNAVRHFLKWLKLKHW